jgi:hypothetical protein
MQSCIIQVFYSYQQQSSRFVLDNVEVLETQVFFIICIFVEIVELLEFYILVLLILSFVLLLHEWHVYLFQYSENHISRSIYAAFKITNPSKPGLLDEFLPNVRLVIWTTTPWTIPANAGEVMPCLL